MMMMMMMMMMMLSSGDSAGVRSAAFLLSECFWKDPTGTVRFQKMIVMVDDE